MQTIKGPSISVSDTYYSKLKTNKQTNMLKVNCLCFGLFLQLHAEENLKIVIPFVSHASNFAEFSNVMSQYLLAYIVTNAKIQGVVYLVL